MQSQSESRHVTVIRPMRRWEFIDLKEYREYGDLFYYLVWRNIKVLYAQTILGFAWAILNPFFQIVIFTVIFGRVAQISTDGVPYVLFATVAIIPWTYISEAMTQSSESLVAGQGMLGKIYYPRMFFPLTPVLAKLADFGISLLLLVGVLFYYQVSPTWNLLLLPIFFVQMVCIPAGIGLWLSALAIRYRDVRFAMPFLVRMLIYSAPILYTASSIPTNYRLVYSLNPIVSVVEGYRSCLLGTPFEWLYILPGMIATVVLVFTGAFYFRKMERVFVDVI